MARCWGSVQLVDPPSPSGWGTQVFSLSILRSWILAPSRGMAHGASWSHSCQYPLCHPPLRPLLHPTYTPVWFSNRLGVLWVLG